MEMLEDRRALVELKDDTHAARGLAICRGGTICIWLRFTVFTLRSKVELTTFGIVIGLKIERQDSSALRLSAVPYELPPQRFHTCTLPSFSQVSIPSYYQEYNSAKMPGILPKKFNAPIGTYN